MSDPVQPDKGGVKMIPESDLLAVKSKLKKLEGELDGERRARADVEAQLKIAKTNGEDSEEVKVVKRALLEDWDRLKADKDKYQKDRTDFEGERKQFTVAQLANKYGVTVEAIADKDDPEKEALRLYAEMLAKEKAESPRPGVYEAGAPAITKVDISKINVKTPEGRKQLAEVEAQWKEEALSKK